MAWTTGLPFAGLLLLTAAGLAAPPGPKAGTLVAVEDGSSLFRSYCSSCHGAAAQGDGTLAQSLSMAPPDLTRLAKHNKGKFDSTGVARTIDGRDPPKGHGGPDMPVWGDVFKRSRGSYSDKAVRDRVDALVEYLERVQVAETPAR